MSITIEYKTEDGKEREATFTAKTVEEVSKLYIEWADKLNYGTENNS